jgi:hypothetical protein
MRTVRVPLGLRDVALFGKAGTPCFLSTMLLELGMRL